MAVLESPTIDPAVRLRAQAELAARKNAGWTDPFWASDAMPGGVNRLADDIRTQFARVIPYVEPIDWEDAPIPGRWHSCTRMSKRGSTQVRGKVSVIPTEVCPCGGYRMLNMRDGLPSYWMDKNTRRRSR